MNGNNPDASKLDELTAVQAIKRPGKLIAALEAYIGHDESVEEFDDIVASKIRDIIECARKGPIIDFLKFDYVLLNTLEFRQERIQERQAQYLTTGNANVAINNLDLLRRELRKELYETAELEIVVCMDPGYLQEVAKARQEFGEDADEDNDDILFGYLVSDDFLRLCARQDDVFAAPTDPYECEGQYPEQRHDNEGKGLAIDYGDNPNALDSKANRPPNPGESW